MVLAYTRMTLIGLVSVVVLVLTACDNEPKEKNLDKP